MKKIRAAVCHIHGEGLVIEEVALAAPGPGQVEVALKACAICHSDIVYMDGGWGGTLPAVYGHEAAGHVSALGEGVRDLAVGDPVLVTLIHACGHCRGCATGEPTLCENPADRLNGPLQTVDGGVMEQGLQTGAFAQRVVVHHSQLAPIPADMPMDVASLMSCGVITGVGSVVNTAGLRPGQTAVVIGAGGVGLNVIQGAYLSGAAKIIAVDLNPEKLDAAVEFGATHGVLAGENAAAQVKTLTGGRGVDFVFVAVGAPKAFETALDYLSPGGKMILVGMTNVGAQVAYEPVNVTSARQAMVGSVMGDTNLKRDIPWLIDLYQQGRLKLDELITGRWRLEQINEAIADTRTGLARRNVILFD